MKPREFKAITKNSTMLLLKLVHKADAIIRRVLKEFRCFSSCHMDEAMISVYEEAVYALNGLQSNAAAIQKAREERSANAHLNISLTQKHLFSLGIQHSDLNNLNVIHIAGTKGKGSTCAFTESILRRHGYKTGFFSSPHLISVNERIRINGKAISKEMFSKYFWKVYEDIKLNLADGENMPSYFLFLTVMAFYIFVKEQVQVAVVEVGIGGLWDCTNVIKKPVVVGITTLGIDHVNILGNSITEIAAQKAGILKPGVPAFTVSQHENAMKVLQEKSQLVKCPLLLSPPIEAYDKKVSLGVQGPVQNVNASLALQLANEWLKQKRGIFPEQNVTYLTFDSTVESYPVPVAHTFDIDLKTSEALETCVWPGRFQVVQRGKVRFYLDGAHTQQSMKHCSRWFEDSFEFNRTKYEQPVLRVLYFNCTGERKAESLLDPLLDVPFDLVIFSPNRIHVMADASSDLSNFMVDPEKEIKQCVTNRAIWRHLRESLLENELSMSALNSSSSVSGYDTSYEDNTIQFPCISSVLQFISSPDTLQNEHIDNPDVLDKSIKLVQSSSHVEVLVTGSLHLVGGVLSLLGS